MEKNAKRTASNITSLNRKDKIETRTLDRQSTTLNRRGRGRPPRTIVEDLRKYFL
jgi:hypothetical protein